MQIDPLVQTKQRAPGSARKSNHQEIRPLLPDNGFGSLAIFLQQKVESRLQGQSCASFGFLAYPLGVSADLTDKRLLGAKVHSANKSFIEPFLNVLQALNLQHFENFLWRQRNQLAVILMLGPSLRNHLGHLAFFAFAKTIHVHHHLTHVVAGKGCSSLPHAAATSLHSSRHAVERFPPPKVPLRHPSPCASSGPSSSADNCEGPMCSSGGSVDVGGSIWFPCTFMTCWKTCESMVWKRASCAAIICCTCWRGTFSWVSGSWCWTGIAFDGPFANWAAAVGTGVSWEGLARSLASGFNLAPFGINKSTGRRFSLSIASFSATSMWRSAANLSKSWRRVGKPPRGPPVPWQLLHTFSRKNQATVSLQIANQQQECGNECKTH